MTSTPSALVLFSGGQDSAVCLAWALEHYAHVETIGFRYGQRHAVELEVRLTFLAAIKRDFPRWGPRLGDDRMIELTSLAAIGQTALTIDTAIEMTAAGLPNTFVPGRNLLFFTYAAALAYRRGIATLVGGMCETDYSGYPDCRNDTLQTLATAISLGMAKPFEIATPLMYLTKQATWEMAHALGGAALVDRLIEDTHTCYLGIRSRRHAWGYGCNHCPACDLRRKGFEQWQITQSTRS